MDLRLAALGILLTLSQACTTLPAEDGNPDDEQVGENIEDLYRSWGAPSATTELPDSSRTLYIWDLNGCRANVTADEAGEVLGYAMSGDCASIVED